MLREHSQEPEYWSRCSVLVPPRQLMVPLSGAVARRRGYRGARALYTALLMKLAAAGYEFKTPSTTAQEYAVRYQELQHFAADYTRLRYRAHAADSERGALWQSLLQNYREVVRGSRRDGLRGLLRRTFSLRGLRY